MQVSLRLSSLQTQDLGCFNSTCMLLRTYTVVYYVFAAPLTICDRSLKHVLVRTKQNKVCLHFNMRQWRSTLEAMAKYSRFRRVQMLPRCSADMRTSARRVCELFKYSRTHHTVNHLVSLSKRSVQLVVIRFTQRQWQVCFHFRKYILKWNTTNRVFSWNLWRSICTITVRSFEAVLHVCIADAQAPDVYLPSAPMTGHLVPQVKQKWVSF